MTVKKIAVAAVSAYLIFCGFLILESGIFSAEPDNSTKLLSLSAGISEIAPESKSAPQMSAVAEKPVYSPKITAENAIPQTFVLGSVEPAEENPFKLELNFTTKGAAIEAVRLRDYDDRDSNNPQPLQLLSTVESSNTMSSSRLLLPDIGKSFPLDRLNWQSQGKVRKSDGSQQISFSAVINENNKPLLKLTKTYTLWQQMYLIDCDIAIDNLSSSNVSASLETLAAVGVAREGSRTDMRNVSAAFLNDKSQVETVKIPARKLAKEPNGKKMLFHKRADYDFLWAAVSNKYFAVIVRPVPEDQQALSADWIVRKQAVYYDPDRVENSADENSGLILTSSVFNILPATEQKHKFQIYLGPKDRHLFNNTELYKQLGFIKAIDFQACFGNLFSSMSFAILSAMNWIYQFIPNYGIVIIIFVCIVRLLLHPITKKSQVSMMKMSKLGPLSEEIKKKYANNKAEMQKQMMGLYKEHGASPVLGCLPMLLQMPIWISLYSAIYAGIEFRGAAFLPFWITDLSSPDSLFALPAAVEQVPVIGSFIGANFNLLPLLLGAAMFAQQKLMPSSAQASSNPQAAQQQKMMMWMMPIMMFLFLYRAPSGLNLYIMASTSAGVIEQYVIRKHIREKEQAEESHLVATTSKTGAKFKKKKPKPPIKFS